MTAMQPTTPTTTDPPGGNDSIPQAGHAHHIEDRNGVACALAALARLLGRQAAQEVLHATSFEQYRNDAPAKGIEP
jgi:hypothetical protein